MNKDFINMPRKDILINLSVFVFILRLVLNVNMLLLDNMKELQFLMDVSPQWWIKARNNEKFLKQYVFEKFERDYYPRIIQQGRRKIDLDYDGSQIKESILKLLRVGYFSYEFLPEDDSLKESYLISNGYVQFQPRRKIINSRLLIKVAVNIV
jgi:hypothetical protein